MIFAIGNYILLNTHNLPLQMVGTKKLAPLWVRPYKVLEVINSNAYKLALPIRIFQSLIRIKYYYDNKYN